MSLVNLGRVKFMRSMAQDSRASRPQAPPPPRPAPCPPGCSRRSPQRTHRARAALQAPDPPPPARACAVRHEEGVRQLRAPWPSTLEGPGPQKLAAWFVLDPVIVPDSNTIMSCQTTTKTVASKLSYKLGSALICDTLEILYIPVPGTRYLVLLVSVHRGSP